MEVGGYTNRLPAARFSGEPSPDRAHSHQRYLLVTWHSRYDRLYSWLVENQASTSVASKQGRRTGSKSGARGGAQTFVTTVRLWAYAHSPPRGVWGHAPPENFGNFNSLRAFLMQSGTNFWTDFSSVNDRLSACINNIIGTRVYGKFYGKLQTRLRSWNKNSRYLSKGSKQDVLRPTAVM